MADIINVSDIILRLDTKSRTADSDTTTVSDAVTAVVELRERDKVRIISETSTVSETLQAYKNDEELIPPEFPIIPQVPNIIGFRQQAVRAPRRAPRAILLEAELTNLIIAPLKLLAFTDSLNKAIVGIRPRLVQNAALSLLKLTTVPQRQQVYSSIKIEEQPMVLKSQLALLSSPEPEMWARAKLKTRPDTQSIHALKAVNFEKMYKLTRIMKIAMLAQSL